MLALLMACGQLPAADIWINEIDYDQPGTDATEFVELAGLAGTYTNVVLELINGNDGSTYGTYSLGNITLTNESGGYGFYVVGATGVTNVDFTSGVPSTNAIQNGAPDGAQLKVNGSIVDAVSYEGQMNDGDGNPMEDVDSYGADMYEGAADTSISRIGLDDSPWEVTATTPGVVNTGQSFDSSPQLSITSPADGTTVYSTTVSVSFSVYNFVIGTDGHIHYTLDGGSTQMQSTADPIEFTDLALGSHTVNVWLVDNSHADLDPPVTGSVTFTVEELSTVSIYDIQGQTDSSPYAGQTLTTTGIITGVAYNGIFLQDGAGAWNGIWVYLGSSGSLAAGDSVTVTGLVAEYNGLTELEDATVTVISSGNTLPDATAITTAEMTEQYEGVLVSFASATCTVAPDTYGEWKVDDGSGEATIDDKVLDYDGEVGTSYNITGVGDYSYGIYKVQATIVEEFVDPNAPVADAGEDQQVEPGTLVTLDGTGSSDADGVIIGYLWEQLSGPSVTLSDYEEAVVTFTAPAEVCVLEFKLTVIDNNASQATDEVVVNVGSFTIYDIQYATEAGSGTNDCYPSPYVDEEVTVSGVVTGVKPGTYPNFFLQQPGQSSWGGVLVYDTSVNPMVGDSVTVTATVTEYFGLTELKTVSGFTINSSGNTIDPIAINSGDLGITCSSAGEQFEGMLVELMNVTVDSVNQYNSWYVNDGSGQAKIDDYYFDGTWTTPDAGVTYETIIGVVDYAYGEYQIYPLSAADLVVLGGLDEPQVAENINLISNYPNPFNPVTTICYQVAVSGRTTVTIFDLLGNQVTRLVDAERQAGQDYSVQWNGTDSNGKAMPSGIYFSRLVTGSGTLTQKITLLK